MLKKIPELKKKHQVLTAVLVGTSVIAFWRGVWGLFDLYLFPNNPPISFLISVVIGILILWITDYMVKELM